MKYGYYPGCSLHSTGSEYDESFRAVCGTLNVELAEVPNWICCGTSPAHSSSHELAIALPVKNMALAENAGMSDLVVPCAACFSRFKFALYEIDKHNGLLDTVNKIADTDFKKKISITHPLELLSSEDSLKAISGRVVKDLSNMKIACYYGCLLTRPPEAMKFDSVEYPMSMDNILRGAGMLTLDWSYKTECCGAVFSLTQTDVVLKLCNDILAEAKALDADAIAVACPLCHANLDTRQEEIETKYNAQYKLPVFYFTQLLGLAFGIPAEKLGMPRHLVSTDTASVLIK